MSNEAFFDLPNDTTSLEEVLNNTNPKKIFFSSDWHIGQNHYKHEKNYVNTQDIVSWCRQNIKDNDVFMYLGDLIFRYSNEEDQERAIKIYNSLPGIKVLILGNHDRMLGDDFYTKCGFTYVFEEFRWGEYIFTHRPVNMELYEASYLNIHGHIHNIKSYNTTDGKRNVNVYPYWYNNKPVTLDYINNHVDELVKDNYWNRNYGYDESTILETKRSNLPDSAFGIPEDRKYPLDSKEHVKSAIKLFGHADESKKKKLAKNIQNAADKYNLTIPETTQCYKYLTEGGIKDIIPEDITTIVFDMGSVLVDSDTLTYITNGIAVSHIVAHEIYDIIRDKLFFFDRENLDLDHYSIEQIKDYFRSIAPKHILPYTDQIFDMFGQAMYKFDYVDHMLDVLRSKGYSIYYLSNWSKWSHDLESTFFRHFLTKFDGGMFSYESQYVKPEKELYLEFFNKYNLEPSKCFFFDDRAENIIVGEELGMRGYVFDSKETPRILLRDNINIPSDVNNTVLIDTGAVIEAVDISGFNKWFCCEEKNPGCISNLKMHKSIDDAIRADIDDDYFESFDGPIERYLFVCNDSEDVDDDNILVLVGKILVANDRKYQWVMQYPIAIRGDKYCNPVKEWSMAAANPIIGIHKPFILKASKENNMFSPIEYLFSPDIVSDKYLVVNEDAKLQIVDADKYNDYSFEVYEYIGNRVRVGKIAEAYHTGKIVDNTVFYTMLTGKPMLCEDQIDYDNNFRKVDFDYMQESTYSTMATITEGYYNAIGVYPTTLSINESSISFDNNIINEFVDVFKDIDGYYVKNKYTKKRTRSVNSVNDITDSMLYSIMYI